MNIFKGKKTYLVSLAGLGLAALKIFGVIDDHTYMAATTILAPLGVAAIRSALPK